MKLFQDLLTLDKALKAIVIKGECDLVDVDRIAFAGVEDGRIFLIHDENLSDEHPIISPVIDLARRAGMTVDSDVVRASEQYLSGTERVRWFA